ncbi:MAG: HU family DNA-binding protein [Bacteroidales bacterium]|nr:HU family DNA-binding protein [Bacteroidales bacterium]
MPVPYKIVRQCQPGIKGGGQWRYYARACSRKKIPLETLCKEIAKQSTLSPADVVAVITMFTNIVPEKLKDGYTVDLGSLGLFSLSIKSQGRETPENVTSHSISGVQINFRPGVYMKQEIAGVEFVKDK